MKSHVQVAVIGGGVVSRTVGNGAAPPDIDRFVDWLGMEDMYELYGSTEAAISTFRRKGYAFDADQRETAEASRSAYAAALTARGGSTITTEIVDAPPFYYAEDYHQQYLAKNPAGYCGLGGTGVLCPAPEEWAAA